MNLHYKRLVETLESELQTGDQREAWFGRRFLPSGLLAVLNNLHGDDVTDDDDAAAG